MNRGQQAYMASLKFGSNPKANKAKDTNNELKFDELKVHLNLSAYFTFGVKSLKMQLRILKLAVLYLLPS
jgi:hypothetical protein